MYLLLNSVSKQVLTPIIDLNIKFIGLLVAFIGIKIARLYKKYCWDIITILVTFISMAIAIYFGDWIKTVLPFDFLFFLLLVQVIYVGIRWYVKGWRETRGYY